MCTCIFFCGSQLSCAFIPWNFVPNLNNRSAKLSNRIAFPMKTPLSVKTSNRPNVIKYNNKLRLVNSDGYTFTFSN